MTDTTVAPRVQTRGADRTTTTTAPARFADLGISPRVVDALAKRGIDEPFAIQSLVMADALAGRDVLAKSRTGSGKTLAFAVPLVETLTPSDRSAHGADPRPDPRTREPGHRGVPRDRRRPPPAGRGRLRRRRDPAAGQARRHADIVIATPGRLLDLVARKLLRLDRVRKRRAGRGRPHARHGVPARRHADPAAPAPRAPDDALLRHPRRRGRPAREALHARRRPPRDQGRPARRRRGHPPLRLRGARRRRPARWCASSRPTEGSPSCSSAPSAAPTASRGT